MTESPGIALDFDDGSSITISVDFTNMPDMNEDAQNGYLLRLAHLIQSDHER